MQVTSLTSIWPATPQRGVSFIQVGDFMNVLLRNAPDLSPCEFCRTLNGKGVARCRVCGGTLPGEDPRDEDEGKGRRIRPPSDARSLAGALFLVLIPALLLFMSFGAWYMLRSQVLAAGEGVALNSAAGRVAPTPATATVDQRRLVRAGVAMSAEGRDAPTIEPEPVIPATPEPRRAAPKLETNRPVSRTSRAVPSPLAVCEAANFLARAVCVNNMCAKPSVARLDQCREVLRQRRIDEARRNPILMG